MSQEHLIPLNQRSLQEARTIQSKGGTTKSPQKRFAASLRELKKKGITDDSVTKMCNLLEDPICSALDIKVYIESLKEEPLSTQQKIQLGQLMVAWHKAHHGEKIKNLNVNLTSELIDDLSRWFVDENNQ